MKTFKEYISEMPHLMIDPDLPEGRQYLDLQTEDDTEEYNQLVKQGASKQILDRAERNAKTKIKLKLIKILTSTEEFPYEDKYGDKFYVSNDTPKAELLIKFFNAFIDIWINRDQFDPKLAEWAPMVFMIAAKDMIRLKILTTEESDKVIDHIDTYVKEKLHAPPKVETDDDDDDDYDPNEEFGDEEETK